MDPFLRMKIIRGEIDNIHKELDMNIEKLMRCYRGTYHFIENESQEVFRNKHDKCSENIIPKSIILQERLNKLEEEYRNISRNLKMK